MAGTLSTSGITPTAYGDSFTIPYGDKLSTTKTRGDILTSRINKDNITDEVEFSDFEENIKSFILARLGFPTVRVELTYFQIKSCIDEAVSKIHYHAPFWATQYATLQVVNGINIYELPQHVADNISYVTYRKNMLGINWPAGSIESDYFIRFFQGNYVFNNFSLSDYYLFQISMEMTRKILGQDGTWEIVNGKYLQIYPIPNMEDVAIIEYRALDSDTLHPAYRLWIQKYALACAKGILGEVRGKYETLPGPSGGAKLNGEAMLARSDKDKEKLELELLDNLEGPSMFQTY